ncbi:phage tail protein [Thauera humireducens]|uniref:phage tail protein n=1 Tax=Thauera humireducens TaxID=1134435 RepID=UPI0031202841
MGTTYGPPKTVSGVSNASPGVASATAHGFTDGDIVVMTSGWPSLNGAVVRVDNSTADAFDLEGFDTTNVTAYPAGQGGGTAREVTAWVSLSQVTDVQTSGGEQQFYQWQYLEEKTQRQRPTVKSARSMSLTVDYDPDLAWHAALLTADALNTPHVIRAQLPSGKVIYYNMYVAYDGEPSFTINQNQQVMVSLSYENPRSKTYAPVTP